MKELTDRITTLETIVIEHYRRLNIQSTWLFVAVVGCWGISVLWVQVFALLIILYYLLREIFDGLNMDSSYPKEIKLIRSDIKLSNFSESDKEQLLGKLWKVETKYLTIFQSLKLNIKIILAFVFMGVSAYYFTIDFMNSYPSL